MSTTEHRLSISSNRGSEPLQQFPDFESTPRRGSYTIYEEEDTSDSANGSRRTNGPALHSDRWQPRQGYSNWSNGSATGGKRHQRQKSLSDAIKTIRARKGSVSANAQEIAEALKAPVSYKLVVCSKVAIPFIETSADSGHRRSASSGILVLLSLIPRQKPFSTPFPNPSP